MIVYFDHNDTEALKMLIIYLYELADEQKDPVLWQDTNRIHKKIKKAMETYGHVVNEEMNDGDDDDDDDDDTEENN